jgi:hypothetical protein
MSLRRAAPILVLAAALTLSTTGCVSMVKKVDACHKAPIYWDLGIGLTMTLAGAALVFNDAPEPGLGLAIAGLLYVSAVSGYAKAKDLGKKRCVK